MFFHISDSTIQQNEFLIKGKIKAAAMLFDVIAFQTREREANSLLQSTPWLRLEEAEFCSDSLTQILEVGKMKAVMWAIIPSLRVFHQRQFTHALLNPQKTQLL